MSKSASSRAWKTRSVLSHCRSATLHSRTPQQHQPQQTTKQSRRRALRSQSRPSERAAKATIFVNPSHTLSVRYTTLAARGNVDDLPLLVQVCRQPRSLDLGVSRSSQTLKTHCCQIQAFPRTQLIPIHSTQQSHLKFGFGRNSSRTHVYEMRCATSHERMANFRSRGPLMFSTWSRYKSFVTTQPSYMPAYWMQYESS